MEKNDDGTYTYLKVPYKYACVYNKLLIKMSDLGLDILKDCVATCRGSNRELINCWNMFSAACSAYTLGYGKQASIMMNYINKSLALGCTEYATEEEPYIVEFKLNIDPIIIGSMSGPTRVYFNTAEMTFGNIEQMKLNTLGIYKRSGQVLVPVATGLPLKSPVKFNDTFIDVGIGGTYMFTAMVEDKKGNLYQAEEDYVVVCQRPPKSNVMYYNFTNIPPKEFEKLSYSDILNIPGATPKAIVGDDKVTFIIHQEDTIHYLLIPDTIELIWAEYGDIFKTTLWDGTGNNAAYRVRNFTDENGNRNTLYFLYTPILFNDDIRITVKNK